MKAYASLTALGGYKVFCDECAKKTSSAFRCKKEAVSHPLTSITVPPDQIRRCDICNKSTVKEKEEFLTAYFDPKKHYYGFGAHEYPTTNWRWWYSANPGDTWDLMSKADLDKKIAEVKAKGFEVIDLDDEGAVEDLEAKLGGHKRGDE